MSIATIPSRPDGAQLEARSISAIRALQSVAIIDGIAVIAGVVELARLNALRPDALVAELDLAVSEAVLALVGFAQLAAYLLAAVFFLRWFLPSYSWLPDWSGVARKRSRYMAGWGFFIPVMSLWVPYGIAREIWKQGERRWKEQPPLAGIAKPVDNVSSWWAMYLLTGFLGNASFRASFRAETAQEYAVAQGVTLVSDGFDVAAALVAAAFVASLTAIQRPFVDTASANVAPVESTVALS